MKRLFFLLPALLIAEECPPEPRCYGNPSFPACPCGYSIETVGELLYLQPFEEGLTYAIRSDIRQTAGGADGTPGGAMIDLEPRWEPAFRISIGYVPSVTVRLIWMQLLANTVDHSKSQINSGLGLQGIWMPAIDNPVLYSSASFRWKLDANTFDLEVGKSYETSRFLTFNPSFGARFALLDQAFHAVYQADEVMAMNDFHGIGPRMALSSDWKFAHGWAILSKAAWSMMFGSFKTHYGFVSEALPSSTLLCDVEDSFDQLVPSADLSLGVGWGRCFAKNQVRFRASLHYEAHVFWAQNQLRTPLGSDAPALAIQQPRDLSIQGFAIRGECEF